MLKWREVEEHRGERIENEEEGKEPPRTAAEASLADGRKLL